MASDDKKTKADPAQKTKADPVAKSDAPKKDKSASDAKSSLDTKGTADVKSSADAAPAKAEGGEKEAGSPSSYHRGEGQKPVSQAYRDNWSVIFGEKEKKKR
jgi:hypothetical protein